MDYHVALGILSIGLGLVGYALYFRSIFRGETKPHVFTWLAYAVLDSIIFTAQFTAGGGAGAFPVLLGTVANATIAFLAFRRRGEIHITRSDWVFFGSSILAIVLWVVTKEPLGAVIILTLANWLAFVPTLRKAYVRPNEESISIWFFDVLRFGTSIFALTALNATTVLFPANVVIVDGLFVLLVLLRRMRLARIAQP